VSPIGSIASQHNLLHQQYADDAQFFIELSSPTCHPDVHQLKTSEQIPRIYKNMILRKTRLKFSKLKTSAV
jgi:hypothetical protein